MALSATVAILVTLSATVAILADAAGELRAGCPQGSVREKFDESDGRFDSGFAASFGLGLGA